MIRAEESFALLFTFTEEEEEEEEEVMFIFKERR